MSWKDDVFKSFRLYAVTAIESENRDMLEKIEAAYRGGADIVQFRSKRLSDQASVRLCKRIRSLAERYRKLFFVNDRPDLAMAVDADGVHLGQEDLPVGFARRLFKQAGKRLWIGKSTHSLKQAVSSAKEKPDYIGVGPIFGTPTKPDYVPVGLKLIVQVNHRVSLPVVAIGGIDGMNVDQVLSAGARRVAVVRAIFSQGDVYAAVKNLRKKIDAWPSR